MEWIIGRCNEVLFGIKNEIQTESLNPEELENNLLLASQHGVLPVVMTGMENMKITSQETRNVIIKWYAVSEQSKKRYQKRIELMKRLALQFRKAGLDVMFLKGATIAQLYPEPQLRVFSDIDYYMYGKSEDSIRMLKEMGIETKEYFNHHTQAALDGILLENHYDFLDRQNHQGNLLLDDELKRLASVEGHKYPYRFDNIEIDNAYTMSPTMNAIFLMRHMAGHFFSETVPLRMIYDWALFLKYYTSDIDWKQVQDLYEKSGMPDFPRMIQSILVSKIGLHTLDCPIEPLYNKTTEKIWESIVKPPIPNPHKKNSFPFLLYEARVFIGNQWKHSLVFKGESYWKLFVNYAWLYLKQKVTQNG